MHQQITWVDFSKGVGILFVVFYHVISGLYTAKLGVSETFSNNTWTLLSGFTMPLFFLLSGLFVEKWLKKEVRFRAKIQTILYPYLIWSIIHGSINVFFSSFTNNPMSWGKLIESIFFNPFGHFWYLYVLFIYFSFHLILRSFLSPKQVWFLSVVLFFLSPYFDNMWLLGMITAYYIYFTTGSVINKQMISSLSSSKIPLLLSCILFVSYNYIYLSFPIIGYARHLEKLIAALIGISFMISWSVLITKFNSKTVSLILYFGRMSLVIYLIHVLATAGFRIIASRLFGLHNIPLHILLGMMAGVILPLICYEVLKFLGLTKWFFSITATR